MKILKFLFISFLIVLLQSGCDKKEEKPPKIKSQTTKNINQTKSSTTTKKTIEKVLNYNGRYSYGYIKKTKNDSRGFIDIKQIKDIINFKLELDGGEPDYQMGSLSGKIKIKENSGTYSDKEYKNCKIIFKFKKNSIKIRQKGSSGDCGFGMGIVATGEFYKQR